MVNLSQSNILIYGCGKMASSLVDIWIQNNTFKSIYALSKSGVAKYQTNNSVNCICDLNGIDTSNIDIVLIGVKPTQFVDIIDELKKFDPNKTVFVSIMAGISIDTIKKAIGEKYQIVRTMPNTPVGIGKGVVGIFPFDLSEKVLQIFQPCGVVYPCENEEELHIITATSGSGVAYIYNMIHIMSKVAHKLGVSNIMLAEYVNAYSSYGASGLYSKTITDAISNQNPQFSGQFLIDDVVSKGGTTEAALKIFNEEVDTFENIIKKAMFAAHDRSVQISKIIETDIKNKLNN